MAANQYGIDMGQVLRDSESIKSARIQNKLAGLKLSEAEGKVERRNVLSATPNDSAAQQDFLMQGGDPQLVAQINALSSQQKQQQQQQSQEIVQRSAYVLGAKSEGEYLEKWGQATKDMDPKMFEGLPAIDSPEFIPASRKFLTDAFSMNKAIQEHIAAGQPKGDLKAIKHGNESLLVQDGNVLERKGGDSYVTPAQRLAREKYSKSIGDTQQKNLYKDIAGLAGAEIGPDGSLVIFKKDNAKWNQAMTLALKYLADKKYSTTTEAALQAAKKYGLVTKDQLAPEAAGSQPEQGGGHKEGTVIHNKATGQRMVMTDGQWMAQQ
ncbi:MAG: hypothetical protein RPR40_13660 [Bermanella sp.]